MRGLSAEQTVEAVRRGAEACERSLNPDQPTERDLVKALIDNLPACWKCLDPATKRSDQRPSTYCDAHCPGDYEATGGQQVSWSDIAHAPALRALFERMKAWDVPMPGAGEALLGDEGDPR